MIRLPPGSTRTDTIFPATTPYRAESTRTRPPLDGAFTNCALPIYMPICENGRFNVLKNTKSPAFNWLFRIGRLNCAICWVLWGRRRSEEHTSELQSLMRISYAVFCLKKKNKQHITDYN